MADSSGNPLLSAIRRFAATNCVLFSTSTISMHDENKYLC